MVNKKILFASLLAMAVHGGRAQEKKISVYAFVGEECPVSIFMAATLKSVSDLYVARAGFYLVFPVSTSTNKSAAAFQQKHGLTNFVTRVDKDRRITRRLNATVTPEVVITGPDDAVLYQGRINDAYSQPGKRKHIYTSNDLLAAIEKIVNGQEIPRPWKPPVGCYITNDN